MPLCFNYILYFCTDMCKRRYICFCLLLISIVRVYADAQTGNVSGTELMLQIRGVDTLYLATLHDIYVFPPIKFKNKRQEQFYWRTVRDVKKTLPYAKLIALEMQRTNAALAQFSTQKEQREYIRKYEKGLFKKYEPAFRKMTARQGQLLMKLVDRECNKTSYELIKLYKGSVTAFFWQGFARIFGNNLKAEYDALDQDRITERIILLVEAGQL